MSGNVHILLDELQDEQLGSEYGGNNTTNLFTYPKFPKFFVKLSGTVTEFNIRKYRATGGEYIKVTEFIPTTSTSVLGDYIVFQGQEISPSLSNELGSGYFNYYFKVDGVAYKSGMFHLGGYEVAIPIIMTVKDPHDNLQEGVVIKLNDSILGTTNASGEASIFANETDEIELYKNGFFTKLYTLTGDTSQEVSMSYAIGETIQIGTQIWAKRNLDIDDLQGGIDFPNNDVNNIETYGLLYNFNSIERLVPVIASFDIPSYNDYEVLRDFVGSNIEGKVLKEAGDNTWLTGNSGTNDYGFAARGAGLVYNGSFLKFKDTVYYGTANRDRSRNYQYNTDIGSYSTPTLTWYISYRLKKASTPATFNFSISVNSSGAAVQGATVTVEGNEYTTDINGQVHLQEYKTSVDYSISKVGYTTQAGTIDTTIEYTKIVTLPSETYDWRLKTTGNTTSLNGIAVNNNNIVSIGGSQVYVISSDAGENWTLGTIGFGLSYNDVYMINATAFACGEAGNIAKSTDSGANWTDVSGSSGVNNAVYMESESIVYVVGSNGGVGVIRKTTNGGANWTDISLVTSDTRLNSVCFKNTNTGLTVGESGIIYKTTNAGVNWNSITSPTSDELLGVEYDGVNKWIICGRLGVVYTSIDDGANWVDISEVTAEDFENVSSKNTDNIFIANSDDSNIIYERVGSAWDKKEIIGERAMDIQMVSNNLGYACLQSGDIVKYSLE